MTPSTPLDLLTARQLRILRVLSESGWLYKVAADRLGMPEATVRTTIHRAARRAGMSARTDLAYWLGVQDGYDGSGRDRRPGTALADGGALDQPPGGAA